jgi:hypothetical protein
MHKSRILNISLALLVIMGVIVILLFFIKNIRNHKDISSTVLALLKSKCEIFQESPYRDSQYGFSIEFSNDQILCLIQDNINETHDVYVWKKNAFESKNIDDLQSAIQGKVSVNQPQIKKLNILGTFSTKIDNATTTGEIVSPNNCNSNECPRAKRVIIQRFNKEFSIEEYDNDISLFNRVHFNSAE